MNLKNALLFTLFGIMIGLITGALVVLVAARPRGLPITLQPAPTPSPILVDVAGAVRQPGVYPLPRDSRVQDAIQAAGGLSDTADQALVNLAARLHDGDKVSIPVKGDTPRVPVLQEPAAAANSVRTPGPRGESGSAPTATPTRSGPVNLNTATLEELQTLPGIGPTYAQAIIDYRQAKGGFKSIEELQNVKGIGPAKFEKLKGLIIIQ